MAMNAHDDELEPYAEEVFAGSGAAVERLRLQVARISPHFRKALLTGERGVGKLTVARQIHRLSPVASQPFRAMQAVDFANHTAPRGLDAGTIYLRGLEALAGEVQECLLKRLRTLGRETRVILTSECDLRGVVAAGRMQQGLYQYAATLEIRVAPLRERMVDLPVLAEAMMGRLASSAIFGASAMDRFQSYGWPGNLSELWTMCGAMTKVNGRIEQADLAHLDSPPPGTPPDVRLDAVMLRHVVDVLQQCAGNKLKAAELLGISRSTLYRMLDSAGT